MAVSGDREKQYFYLLHSIDIKEENEMNEIKLTVKLTHQYNSFWWIW